MRVRIKEVRKTVGLSQLELAERVGLSRPYLSQIEDGKRNLSTKRQKLIADALGVDPTELVDFDAPDKSDEDTLIRAFRKLAPAQRRAWLDMARIALGSTDSE